MNAQFEQGYMAYLRGEALTQNPYMDFDEVERENYQSWFKGWQLAKNNTETLYTTELVV